MGVNIQEARISLCRAKNHAEAWFLGVCLLVDDPVFTVEEAPNRCPKVVAVRQELDNRVHVERRAGVQIKLKLRVFAWDFPVVPNHVRRCEKLDAGETFISRLVAPDYICRREGTHADAVRQFPQGSGDLRCGVWRNHNALENEMLVCSGHLSRSLRRRTWLRNPLACNEIQPEVFPSRGTEQCCCLPNPAVLSR